jgi:hypothetical protein
MDILEMSLIIRSEVSSTGEVTKDRDQSKGQQPRRAGNMPCTEQNPRVIDPGAAYGVPVTKGE